MLDVGQGDAILLEPPGGDPVLVDTGPPGAGRRGGRSHELRRRAARRRSSSPTTTPTTPAALAEVLARIPVDAARPRQRRRDAAAAAAPAVRAARLRTVADGADLRSGELAARGPLAAARARPRRAAADEPNVRSVVLLARWRRFALLLTGDAEAEAIPLDPGAVDVLKVAHHGSEDAGLRDACSNRRRPAARRDLGRRRQPLRPPHPSDARGPRTARTSPTLRTDRDGDIEVSVTPDGFAPTGMS